jgi:hypothetical protein
VAVEVKLHTFLISVQGRDECSDLLNGTCRTRATGELSSALAGNRTSVFKLVASHVNKRLKDNMIRKSLEDHEAIINL